MHRGDNQMQTGTIKLVQKNSQKTGQPYTALSLNVGKWRSLHFPTAFERDYLVDYLTDGKTGQIIPSTKDGHIHLIAGDYEYDYPVSSVFEYKYINQFLRSNENEESVDRTHDDNIDLEEEDPIADNPFGIK